MLLQAVDVSACGNFGVVGSSAGELAAFNLESGKQRRVFLIDAKSKPKKKLAGGGRNALRKSISGIALDSLNKSLVASTLDGTLYVSRQRATAGISVSIDNMLDMSAVLRLSYRSTAAHDVHADRYHPLAAST